ncbi:MAG: ATP-binding cassette domain-containing protein, partial [Gammaproteobacteria bacterium]|nr:ATP-binding cassette domain-containing protein [Gammaproteobacteria bacterium]
MIENFRIGFRHISKSFGSNRVLEQTAISIASHDCIVITGNNGAGKTTLLRIIAGLEKPGHCEISLDDASPQPWRRLRKRLLKSVMYLHQQPYMFAGSLLRNIEYAARLNPALADRESSVQKAVSWAGLEGLE